MRALTNLARMYLTRRYTPAQSAVILAPAIAVVLGAPPALVAVGTPEHAVPFVALVLALVAYFTAGAIVDRRTR